MSHRLFVESFFEIYFKEPLLVSRVTCSLPQCPYEDANPTKVPKPVHLPAAYGLPPSAQRRFEPENQVFSSASDDEPSRSGEGMQVKLGRDWSYPPTPTDKDDFASYFGADDVSSCPFRFGIFKPVGQGVPRNQCGFGRRSSRWFVSTATLLRLQLNTRHDADVAWRRRCLS